MAMGSKAFESPLIGHTRMRALFRGLVELRAVSFAINDLTTRDLEACFVASMIDLTDGDLACDTGGRHEAPCLEHLRGLGRRTGAAAIAVPAFKRLVRQLRDAQPDPFPGTACERLICAVGSAMALRTAEADKQVVLAFARHRELPRAEWLRILTLAAQPGLPLILLALPYPQQKSLDLESLARKAAGRATPVPVIPVDAGDPIALYRVVQEAAVRARANGGAAVIDCVACGTDPIRLLGTQLVSRGICTRRWVEAAAQRFESLA